MGERTRVWGERSALDSLHGRVLLGVMLFILVSAVAHLARLGGPASGAMAPLAALGGAFVSAWTLLRAGRLALAAHVILVASAASVWWGIAHGTAAPVARLDAIVYLYVVIGLTPLAVRGAAWPIAAHAAANIGVLWAYLSLQGDQLGLGSEALIDVAVHNTFAMALAALVVYVLHRDSRRAMERAAREIERSRAMEASLERRVAERTAELHAAMEAAEAASAEKSRFLSNMSHEIRTPIHGIRGLAHLLLQGELDADQRRQVELVQAQSQNLLRLVNDILDVGRIEHGGMTLEQTSVRLQDVVDGVIDLVRARADEKGLSLSASLEPELPERVETDPLRLHQILLNLVDNAIKYTEEGSVSLKGYATSRGARFVVSDTGIGIPEAAQATLFDRFVQVDPSDSRRYGGSGLGLAIVRDLTELMGGSIGVSSVVGEGTHFWVELPLPEAAPHVEPVGPSSIHRMGSLRVLLAEDNPVNQLVARGALQQLGCVVTVVDDGAQALAALAEGRFDIVLLDLQMPEVDGLEAARRIRKGEGDHAAVPLVAVSASVLPEDLELCYQAGMNDHLPKPFTVEELQATLERWSGPGSRHSRPRLLRPTP